MSALQAQGSTEQAEHSLALNLAWHPPHPRLHGCLRLGQFSLGTIMQKTNPSMLCLPTWASRGSCCVDFHLHGRKLLLVMLLLLLLLGQPCRLAKGPPSPPVRPALSWQGGSGRVGWRAGAEPLQRAPRGLLRWGWEGPGARGGAKARRMLREGGGGGGGRRRGVCEGRRRRRSARPARPAGPARHGRVGL
jgi:hypothetical protein